MNAGWQAARRLLGVRLDNMGDVLMTTPALRALKAGRKNRHLTLLASPAGAAVSRMIPEVDAVIPFEAPWMKATSAASVGAEQDDAIRALLAAGRFDAAVIFTAYSQSPLPAAYFCYLVGIPLRLAHCRENPYHLLSDWIAEAEPASGVRHEIQRQLDLVAHVGCQTHDERLSFVVRDESCQRVRRLLSAQGLDFSRPWIVLHSGATASSRRYPAARFAEAIRLLAAAGCQTVLTGSAGEAADVASIRRQARVPTWSLAGQLDLAELGAVIFLADVVVSNNSGPAHVAAAIGTPLVDLFALTNPQHTPWRVRHVLLDHDVACKYCYKGFCPHGHQGCLQRVEPARVADAVRSLLPFSPHRALRDLMQVRPPDWPADETDSVAPLFDKAPCAGSGS